MSTLRIKRGPIAIAAIAVCSLFLLLKILHEQTGASSVFRHGPAAKWAEDLGGRWPAPQLFANPSSQENARLQTVLSAPSTDNNSPNLYRWYSEGKLRELAMCAALNNCHPNAHKIIIINTPYGQFAKFGNYRGGEGIWLLGMTDSMERLGYTVLWAPGSWEYTDYLYRQVPDNVVAIVGSDNLWVGKYETYMKTNSNPDGIPAWKFFYFYYFPNTWATPVGNQWVVTAEIATEPRHRFQYIGYSIDAPNQDDWTPAEQRPYRVWVFTKRLLFFHFGNHGPAPDGKEPSWPISFYKRASDELQAEFPGFEFRGGFTEERTPEEIKKDGKLDLIVPGVNNVGKLNQAEFNKEVQNCRAMLGIGNPGLSPSPYVANAFGLPFINPHRLHNENNPHDDPRNWLAQQQSLIREGPPYVYNALAHNYTEFITSIRLALRNPIKPYRQHRMTPEGLDERVSKWLETDWKAEATYILEQRLAGNETQDCAPGLPDHGCSQDILI